MTKKEKENLQEFASWIKECSNAHKSRMRAAYTDEEWATHRGSYIAYFNALCRLENIFGDKLWK